MNSLGFPILSLITLMPILCAVVVLFIPNEKVDVMKKTVIGFMGVNLLLTLFMFAQYNVSEGGMQFVENISCSDFLGINYIMQWMGSARADALDQFDHLCRELHLL